MKFIHYLDQWELAKLKFLQSNKAALAGTRTSGQIQTDPNLKTMRYRSTLPALAGLLPAFSGSLPAQPDKLPNIVLIMADNGTHRSIKTRTRSGMVQGAKGQTINTGNHVPMVVSWPDKITDGRVFTGLIDFADFLPTLCEVAGIDPASYMTDGKSFLDVLLGAEQRPGKEEIFIHYTPRWGGRVHSRWVMNSEYKLYRDGGFFNTIKDPGETAPLADPSSQEKAVRDHFDGILSKMEQLHPFDQNDTEFKN